ncbi:Beta-glucosidase A [Candidatus Protochlamydia naegleriophila]|uniref:Beta-glucosidase n=1 Tax=Candidatus Protochlamydia naegleriophila TaxID=389348 RepID=A0A0U5JDH6_9BACT|nr:GH1 family beta-glucosidase [Candidatus Protochlamydia naegleriophila]CUI17165.1 Beta-glucosidase A [Candidatus Protochlamydia naegleriophila]
MAMNMPRRNFSFPKDFLWGTATSAYQIEGGVKLSNRQDSIWDTFCRYPGNILNGENGDIACGHYQRWEDDIILMSKLGIKAYRFSIAWTRIIPEETGAINSEGLNFYDRLIDTLLKYGIEPIITLYHWDLPERLQKQGGWASRGVIEPFLHYALTCFSHFSDRVKIWITHNEPWVIAMLGYRWGIHAPGVKDVQHSLQAAHHLLLSHGMVVEAMRAHSPNFLGKIGIALNLSPVYPIDPSKEADQLAAKQYGWMLNDFFLDALFLGAYPQEILAKYPELNQIIQAEDMKRICVPLDFLGINYYTRTLVKGFEKEGQLESEVVALPNAHSTMWEFYPQGLSEIIEWVWERYHPREIMITENGTALDDELSATQEVLDDRRIEYFQAHLQELHKLIDRSIPISGYFAWSLLDNFEWSFGYQKRFGLVYVDFPTLKRIPKKSATWFGSVSKNNAIAIN